ncbi:MAG: hypothetical protein C0482_21815 [Gordonia sp.]|nr:hypothetical protein [Gordonia sp. (in: high G+C Gram-positive bacteria)]
MTTVGTVCDVVGGVVVVGTVVVVVGPVSHADRVIVLVLRVMPAPSAISRPSMTARACAAMEA